MSGMRTLPILLLAGFAALACSRETTAPAESGDPVDQRPSAASRPGQASVPMGPDPSPEELEKMRFDARWKQLASFRRQGNAASPAQSAGTAPQVQFIPPAAAATQDQLANLSGDTFDQRPLVAPIEGDVSGGSVVRAQTLLDRTGFSPGIIDGRWGRNSEIAVWWFQSAEGIQPTGVLDQRTWQALLARAGNVPTMVRHTLKAQDVEGPFVSIPEDVYDQSELECLCYESLGEKLSEMFHASTDLLERINGGVKLDGLKEGDRIWVPAVGSSDSRPVSRIVVSVEGNYLQGFDSANNIVFHAPTTLGSEFDPSPSETVKITAIAQDPDFNYQPKLFHEVPDDEPEALLPPGPNSPVGVVWMALSKPHFGIHGTSNPSTIGYAVSHGCVRLTNWDARALSRRVQNGVSVEFQDTRG